MLEKEILEKLLRESAAAVEPGVDYCFLTSLKGSDYRGDFLFCGRAGNGWWNEFRKMDIDSHAGQSQIVDRAVSSEDGLTCRVDSNCSKTAPCTGDPLHWVHHLRPRKRVIAHSSAFWRVVGKTVNGFYGASTLATWSSLIAWTNLYKVSRHEGNPGAALRYAQFPAAAELLRWELMEYHPRWAIFFTELDATRGWFARFRDHNLFQPKWEPYTPSKLRYISAIGTLRLDGHPITVIVAEHPQGRKEDLFAETLLETIRV